MLYVSHLCPFQWCMNTMLIVEEQVLCTGGYGGAKWMQREGGGYHVVKKTAQTFKRLESASIATAERSTKAINHKKSKCNLVDSASKCAH